MERARLPPTAPEAGTPRDAVAVIGLACRFPGAPDADAFWRLLVEGREAITPMPAERFDAVAFNDSQPGAPGMVATRLGGFLPDVDRFDAGFFGISPREAAAIDPQHRLLLETSWEAIEDAGLTRRQLLGSRTGVFVGLWTNDYERLVAAPGADVDVFAATGTGRYAAAGRISYAFDLRGPSLVVDTACSSSLVAVHLACRSLRSGDCEVAVVGAANLILDPLISVAYSRSGLLTTLGRCRFGDAAADGYVRSEGVAVVVLRRLSSALAAGDRVRGVIAGSAVNNDGRASGSLMAPGASGHAELLRAAYRDAAIDPRRLRCIEAHGTGTSVGDPVEIEAIASLIGAGADAPCLVGSVKTNIGHTEAAAGLAGLIKVLLALQHRVLPASLHFAQPNPRIDWDLSALQVCTRATEFGGDSPVVAGVSAFGITGTNAHVVVQEAESGTTASMPSASVPEAQLVPLSAHTSASLAAHVRRWREHPWIGVDFADVAYTAALRRTHHARRLAVVAGGFDELRAQLIAPVTPREDAENTPPPIVFVFPGQGSQWAGMGRHLLATEPVARDALQACDAAFGLFGTPSVVDLITRADPRGLDDVGVVQPLLFAVQVMLARLWMSWGIRPGACIGHSMGEVAAAHVSGALSLPDAARIICIRSALLRTKRGRGGMALIEASVAETEHLLEPFGTRLSIAAVNDRQSTVVSGEAGALDSLQAQLEARGCFSRRIRVDVASHGPQMDDLLGQLEGALAPVRPGSGDSHFYSTVTGGLLDGRQLHAAYWARNLRVPVQFHAACEGALRDGSRAFVEISPHPILTPSLRQAALDTSMGALVVPSLRRDQDERRALLQSAGELYTAGCDLEWPAIYPTPRRVVSLPAYPWQRERFWLDRRPSPPAGHALPTASYAEAPGARAAGRLVHEVSWTDAPPLTPSGPASGRWVVVGDDACASELRAALAARGVAVDAAEGGSDLADSLIRDAPDAVVLVAPSAAKGLDVAWSDVEAAILHATQRLLEVVKAVAAASTRTRLWLVTRNAQPVERPPAPVDPVASALSALFRVVLDEHPDLAGGSVDVVGGLVAVTACTIAEHLLASSPHRQIAVTEHRRLIPRLMCTSRLPSTPLVVRADATYLITGGLSGVGLAIAGRLVQRGARHLALVSRGGLPSRDRWPTLDPASKEGRRAAAVAALEARGARVHVVRLDVGDAEAVAAAMAALATAAPLVRGIVHAAAVVCDQLVAYTTEEALRDVMRPKAGGAWNLHRHCTGAPLDFFVCCSSIGSLVGITGQGSYAVANSCLDALAHRGHAALPAITTINWGGWRRLGLLATSHGAQSTVEELEGDGLGAFDVDEGLDAFEFILTARMAQAVVACVDGEKLSRSRHELGTVFHGRGEPLVHDLPAPVALRSRLAAAAPSERRAVVERELQREIANILRLQSHDIPRRTPLGTLGLESLMALELHRRIERALGEKLAKTLVWRFPTIEALGEYLLARLFPGESLVGAAGPDPLVTSTIEAMSEEDALAALLEPERD